jgi:hypothetical protein
MPVWPFTDDHFHFLILECPKCRNQWYFQAIPASGNDIHTIWACAGCGNNETLRFKRLLNFGELGFNFPKGRQYSNRQRDTTFILRN